MISDMTMQSTASAKWSVSPTCRSLHQRYGMSCRYECWNHWMMKGCDGWIKGWLNWWNMPSIHLVDDINFRWWYIGCQHDCIGLMVWLISASLANRRNQKLCDVSLDTENRADSDDVIFMYDWRVDIWIKCQYESKHVIDVNELEINVALEWKNRGDFLNPDWIDERSTRHT